MLVVSANVLTCLAKMNIYITVMSARDLSGKCEYIKTAKLSLNNCSFVDVISTFVIVCLWARTKILKFSMKNSNQWKKTEHMHTTRQRWQKILQTLKYQNNIQNVWYIWRRIMYSVHEYVFNSLKLLFANIFVTHSVWNLVSIFDA